MSNRAEQVEPKMAEFHRAVHRNVEGLWGVFDELADEHAEISELFRIAANNPDGVDRRHLYSQLRQHLLAHEIFELEELYPLLERYQATSQLVIEHAEDAAAFEVAVKNLDSLDVDGPLWEPAFKRLLELFEQHVEQEEYEYFPEAQARLDKEQTQQLQSRFIAAKHAALKLPG